MSILALVALVIVSLIVVLIFVPLIIGTTLGVLVRISHCIHNDPSQKSVHEIRREKEREDFIIEELRGFRAHELIKPRPREDDINSVFIRTMANIKLNAEEFESFLKDEEKERFQAVKHTMECIAEFASAEELSFLVKQEAEERRSYAD